MADHYDIHAIIDALKEKQEMDPDSHDASYELMRETISAYAALGDYSILDFKDLNLVYLTAVGTWKQNVELKKKTVSESHLTESEKERLRALWDSCWEKALTGEYSNYEEDAAGKASIGMFGTGFLSFGPKTGSNDVQKFIRMCVELLPMTDDETMFDRASKTLSSGIAGMGAGSASVILHCLKPCTFPPINGNMKNPNIFEVLGVPLVKRSNIETYIDNCRLIKAYRDQNFPYKNYRIFDMLSLHISDYHLSRMWLITWKPENWQWSDYAEKCELTKRGETVVESWTCSNTTPRIGDDVFLIKLGGQPRGLIGHGTVFRESYETDHYDAQKAADGVKTRHIDVKFDRLLNYHQDKLVSQEELGNTCGAQHWSPQSSGIEIKTEVQPALMALWRTVIESGGKQEEVREKMDSGFARNMILYGPPGTGKTYNSVYYAVSICEGKPLSEIQKENYTDVLARYNTLRSEGRILFTTFHQSYGYEEFIEGIRPVMRDDGNEGLLQYEIRDGIFKQICNAARAPEGIEINHNAVIWFVTLKDGKENDLKTECFRKGEIRFEGTEDLKNDDSWTYERITAMKCGDYVLSYGGGGDLIDAVGIILDDEPFFDNARGSFRWVRKVRWLFYNKRVSVREINSRRLLPRFGIARMNHMRLSDLLQLAEQYGEEQIRINTKPYVLIIDEINRGNISKIFGELITLIEDTKRAGAAEAMEAVLPYSGEVFSVPENVYILGTMNTADRSIALMDTAIRRRFAFTEMMPCSKVLERLGVGTIVIDNEELNVAKMLDVINERIQYLFDRDHTIGHAFFRKLADDPSIDTLADIFEKNVIPLLQEYFYEDYEKIQLVLGDNAKEDEFKFILDKPVNVKDIFNGNPAIDLLEKVYEIQHSAFHKLESYKLIGKDL